MASFQPRIEWFHDDPHPDGSPRVLLMGDGVGDLPHDVREAILKLWKVVLCLEEE